MHWIIQFIIHHRNLSSLALTVLLSLLMLTADTARQQAIARSLTLTLFYPFQFTAHQASRIKNIFAENKKLREEITAISLHYALLQEAASENTRLRQLLGFEETIPYSLIPARAVARDPSHTYRSVVISAGKNQGVLPFMPVINKDGVVGKAIQVLGNISLVQLIRDPAELVSVMTKKNQEVGILETVDGRNFYVAYRTHAVVDAGDTIVTSGLGGIYPKGLNVGVVTTVKKSDDPLFKNIILTPCVNFDHLEEVFVVRISAQWTAFRSELDSIVKK